MNVSIQIFTLGSLNPLTFAQKYRQKSHNVRIDGDTESCPTIESILKLEFPQFPKHYLIHQLDYVTSGIHCWGLNKKATGRGGNLFMKRLVKKTYTALVKGYIHEDKEFVIEKPIAIDLINTKDMCIGTSDNPGKESKTIVTVLRRGYYKSIPATLVQLNPYTGRRHQLRVHMASIGHPIIGDITYEKPLTDIADRTMLHAWKLHLPWTEDFKLDIETKNPFENLLTEDPIPPVGEFKMRRNQITEKANVTERNKTCHIL